MTDGMTEANKDQAEYEARQRLRDEMEAAQVINPCMTELSGVQHDDELGRLIAQTVEQTLAKLREQEHAQKLDDVLTNSENAFAAISDTLGNARKDVINLLKLFAGDQADRLNNVTVSSSEGVTTANWYIDKIYGWAYAPITRSALEQAMAKCIEQADKKRAEEPPTLAEELDDHIPF